MHNKATYETALLGMLFALAMALSFLESTLTPVLGLMPAIKIGLSNIVVMYALLMLGRRPAFLLVLLKAGFAFLVRGATAGFLSLCGGGLSFFTFCVLLALPFLSPGTFFLFAAHWPTTQGSCWGLQFCFLIGWPWATRPSCLYVQR